MLLAITAVVTLYSIIQRVFKSNNNNTSNNSHTIADLQSLTMPTKSYKSIVNTIDNRLQIICIGDSITQHANNSSGWCTLLSDSYSRKADIINRGYSGYTSRDLVLLLRIHIDNQLIPFNNQQNQNNNKQLYTLFVGANDSIIDPNHSQYVEINEFKSNLLLAIELLQVHYTSNKNNNNNTASALPLPLILITPPVVEGLRWAQYQLSTGSSNNKLIITRNHQNTELYSNIIKSIGKQYNIPVIDLFTATTITSNNNSNNSSTNNPYLSDGLHLSTAGNILLYELLLASINLYYPHYSPNQLPLDFPLWDRMREYFDSFGSE